MKTLKVKVRKEKRSYLQVRMKCQIASTVLSWQVSYVDNPGIREKRERRGEERREGRESVQQSARRVLLSRARGEESKLQKPNY